MGRAAPAGIPLAVVLGGGYGLRLGPQSPATSSSACSPGTRSSPPTGLATSRRTSAASSSGWAPRSQPGVNAPLRRRRTVVRAPEPSVHGVLPAAACRSRSASRLPRAAAGTRLPEPADLDHHARSIGRCCASRRGARSRPPAAGAGDPLPDAHLAARGDRRAGGFRVVSIEWLLMQNPRASFSLDRRRLPGQEHPGLGSRAGWSSSCG